METIERVRELRARGCPPKAIARTLGLSPAEVAPLIRAVAAEAESDPAERELVDCWVSRGWSNDLILTPGLGWPDAEAPEGVAGLAGVLVARRAPRRRVSVCGYLVDTHCLGVKNALGPDVMDEHSLPRVRPTLLRCLPGASAADAAGARAAPGVRGGGVRAPARLRAAPRLRAGQRPSRPVGRPQRDHVRAAR